MFWANVRRVYDPAKTPLERLLLCGVLSADQQQELSEVGEALDPLSLLHQLEQLQQAVQGCAVPTWPLLQGISAIPIQLFCVQQCLPETLSSPETGAVATAVKPSRQCEQQSSMGLLDWQRTIRDPFEGQWDQILSLVLAHPEWSGGELFQEGFCQNSNTLLAKRSRFCYAHPQKESWMRNVSS